MQLHKESKKYPWSVAILGTACIPLILYLFISYGELLSKSTSYIKAHYPIANIILLITVVPLGFFLTFVFAYAKAEGYISFKREKYTLKNKQKRLWYYIVILAGVLFLLYNIFCIYIY